jgi:hypothetical protein
MSARAIGRIERDGKREYTVCNMMESSWANAKLLLPKPWKCLGGLIFCCAVHQKVHFAF